MIKNEAANFYRLTLKTNDFKKYGVIAELGFDGIELKWENKHEQQT